MNDFAHLKTRAHLIAALQNLNVMIATLQRDLDSARRTSQEAAEKMQAENHRLKITVQVLAQFVRP
jgi:hypothetical protein